MVSFNKLLAKFTDLVTADNVTETPVLDKFTDAVLGGEVAEGNDTKQKIPIGLILMDKKTVEIYEQIMQTVFYDAPDIQELFKVETENDYYVVRKKTISEVKQVLRQLTNIKDFEYKCALALGLYFVVYQYNRYLAYKENGEVFFPYEKNKYSTLASDLEKQFGSIIYTGEDATGHFVYNNSPITFSYGISSIVFFGKTDAKWYYTQDNIHLIEEIPTAEEILFHELVGEMILGNIGKNNESRIKPVQVGNITRIILEKNTFFSGVKHLPRPFDKSYDTEGKYIVNIDGKDCYQAEVVKQIPNELTKC